MARRKFIIIAANPSAAQQNEVTAILKGRFGHWHWIGNVWFVSTTQEITHEALRDEIMSIVNLHFIVQEVASGKRAAFGPKAWWPWFRKNWD